MSNFLTSEQFLASAMYSFSLLQIHHIKKQAIKN